MTDIQNFLFENSDEKYRDFSRKLIPDVEREKIIGVRAPVLRDKAKQMYRSGTYKAFIKNLPHGFLEENTLHGYILCQLKDYDELIDEIERFLPFVDNWATCDTLRPPVLKKHTDELYEKINGWIVSENEYTVRFAIGMLLSFYLDGEFRKEHLEKAASADSDAYYISMMVAWYFATALAKQYDSAVEYIKNKRLSAATHNRTIRKACESFRVSPEHKAYLKKYIIGK